MSVQLLRRKFTVEQYHEMVDSGILSEEATSDGYQIIQKFERGQTLSILAFPDVNITVNEVLG